MTRFRDRVDAGRRLAHQVGELTLVSPVVLGLPRGGIPVAAEVAAALGATLEVFVVGKIGAPGQSELAIGAVAEGLEAPVISEIASDMGLGPNALEVLAEAVSEQVAHRVQLYRAGRGLPDLEGRDAVVVDDGLATGLTAQAALLALRELHPRRLVLAVPVCAAKTAERLGQFADIVLCVERPAKFFAAGQWYENFPQTSDEEVLALLG